MQSRWHLTNCYVEFLTSVTSSFSHDATPAIWHMGCLLHVNDLYWI